MTGARYVILGLAQARSPWFREVAQWANTGAVSAEFVKCVSGEEVRARLASGRPFSALLIDSTLPALDRDLIDTAGQVNCPVIVVGDVRPGRDWIVLGAAALLSDHFDRKDLIEALAARAHMIGRADRAPAAASDEATGWRAPVVAVTGPGGTGASTVAIALAQGLSQDVRLRGSVLLADFRLRAELAMLHDARDVVPGVQELVDAFRAGHPTANEVRALTFAVPERGYSLLLGLRRSRAWSTVRPRSFESAFAGLRCAHQVIVADVDRDVEGEDEGGSADVEERHVMARTVMAQAEAIMVVGLPGMKGLHSLIGVMTDLLDYGIPGARIVPVINRAPRGARWRAELAHTMAQLLPAFAGAGMGSPVFTPERRVGEALRDGVALPDGLAAPLVGAYRAAVARARSEARRPDVPQAVRPGAVGAWTVDPAGEAS